MKFFDNYKLLFLSLSALGTASCEQEKDYTNFIVINIDDMGYGDLGCTGAIGYQTPNIDKMASEGVRFTHFYSAQAVSGASRMGLLTGCYPNRLHFSGAPDHTSKVGINAGEETMAEVLKKGGYSCAAYGKWHLGHLPEFLPTNNGFDEYYGIPYSNDMWPNHPISKNYYPELPLYEGTEVVELNPDQSQFTTNFTSRTIQFIDKNKNTPFFIYLAHPMCHVPLFVSDKFKGKSEQGLFGDVIMEIDWSVGEILKKLKETGLDDNTLVIFTSDNGPWFNYGNHAGSPGGLREAKGASFEGGQRVPMIAWWKDIPHPGQICNRLASNIDLLPTFAEIAGVELPKNKIDGVSILPLIKQEKGANPRKDFYYYYRNNSLEAVSNGYWKMIFPHKHRTHIGFIPGKDGMPGNSNEFFELKDTLLINLRNDPGERYNVMGEYPNVQKELLNIAAKAKYELGDDLSSVEGCERRPIGRAL